MKCADIIKATGWICSENGQNAFRLTAPFSIGDGELLSFYISCNRDGHFFLTDASETAMYMEHVYGVSLNKNRLRTLNNTHAVDHAFFESDLSIVAEGDADDLDNAIWDAVKLALSLSFKTDKWQRKFNQEKFRSIVFKELTEQIGAEKVINRARIKAASGNTIEFPIGVKRNDGNISFISPLALEENKKFSWANVYQIHGRFSDVKSISDISNRFTILEDGGDQIDEGRVKNFLLDTSSVYKLKSNVDFLTAFNA